MQYLEWLNYAVSSGVTVLSSFGPRGSGLLALVAAASLALNQSDGSGMLKARLDLVKTAKQVLAYTRRRTTINYGVTAIGEFSKDTINSPGAEHFAVVGYAVFINYVGHG
jgi:hypothetical protein